MNKSLRLFLYAGVLLFFVFCLLFGVCCGVVFKGVGVNSVSDVFFSVSSGVSLALGGGLGLLFGVVGFVFLGKRGKRDEHRHGF